MQSLEGLGPLIGATRQTLDLSRPERLIEAIHAQKPDLIVHSAGYTAVDLAESEAKTCFLINAEATAKIAEAAQWLGVPLISYSTDYVFAGTGTDPYRVTDPTGPLNVYGASKQAGEVAIQKSGAEHLVLRTSWVYGLTGHNFLKTMLRLAETRTEINVVSDQIGAPSESLWLAKMTRRLIESTVHSSSAGTRLTVPSQILHLTPRGATSWAGFARAIFSALGISTQVRDIPSEAYPTPAERPRNSRLDCSGVEALLQEPLPEWQIVLEDCLHRLNHAQG